MKSIKVKLAQKYNEILATNVTFTGDKKGLFIVVTNDQVDLPVGGELCLPYECLPSTFNVSSGPQNQHISGVVGLTPQPSIYYLEP